MTSSNDVMTLTVTLLLLTQVRVVTSVFQSSTGIPSEFYIAEELPGGTLVGGVRDNAQLQQMNNTDSLRFVLRQTTATATVVEHFTVDEQSGEIRTRHTIDREQVCLPATRSCTMVFDVVVRPLKYFQIIRVIIHIDDINDHTPTFPEKQLTVHIKESSLPGSTFSLPVATDADSGRFGIQGFEMRSSSAEDLFALRVSSNVEESFDLQLELTGRLDRESMSRHEMNVVAFDGGDPRRSGTVMVSIVVTDANDHSPLFASPSYEVDIVENELPSSAVVRVEASDADEGENSQLVYGLSEFSQTDYSDVFRIDPQTGEVFLRRRLDREIQNLYTLTVTATDHGSPPLSAFTRLTIKVLDVNDNLPRVMVSSASPDKELRVTENSEPLTFVAFVSASDVDLGSAGKVDCYVEGNQFRLEPLYDGADSEYKLLTAIIFDRELQSTVLVTLTCRDRGHPVSRSAAVELVVEISDENDNAPVIASEQYEITVPEGNEIGDEMVCISASDADAGSNAELRFAMTPAASTPVQHLSINEKSGSVTANVRLDYETCHLYKYVVCVSDLGDVPRTSTASLILHVTDVDDERPQFHRSAYYFNVPENASVGTTVGRVAATDSDFTPRFSTVLYHIRGDRVPFSVDRTTGDLSTVRQLDREEQPVFEFCVIATDSSHVETTAAVTVYLDDVNDNDPVIVLPLQRSSHSIFVITVSSHLPADSLLTRIDARDLDDGENGRVTYSLSHGNEHGLFRVDELTGAVTTTQRLPRTFTTYRVVIAARDHGHPARQTLVDLDITVNDTAASLPQHAGVANGFMLGDERFLVVFGIICGVVIVSLLACVLCVLIVLRRNGTKRSGVKPASDNAVGSKDLMGVTAVKSVTSSGQHTLTDWDNEYTRMINEICVKTPCSGEDSVSSRSAHSTSTLTSSTGAGLGCSRCSHCRAQRCRRSVQPPVINDDDVNVNDDADDAGAKSRPPSTAPSTSSSLTSSSSGRRDVTVRAKKSRVKVKSSSDAAHRRSKDRVKMETDSELSTDLSCRDSGLVLHEAVSPLCQHQHHHHHHHHCHSHSSKNRCHQRRHEATGTQDV